MIEFGGLEDTTLGGVPIKDVLIDALRGYGFGSNMEFADRMVKKGLARFSGNQWNEDWQWETDQLVKLEIKDLVALYSIAKNLE